jgi:hypothetical protein
MRCLRLLALPLVSAALLGCSGPDRYAIEFEDDSDRALLAELEGSGRQSVVPEIQKKSEAAQGTPASGAVASGARGGPGEPVYSTSYAIQLAKFVLKDRGLTHEDRAIQVSYCEGVYTVTFPRPETRAGEADFLVLIEEKTSRVLKVQTQVD